MAKGNPLVQFRLPTDLYGKLESLALKRKGGASASTEAKAIVEAALRDSGGNGSPEGQVGGVKAGKRPAATERATRPKENALERGIRLKKEWGELERDHPHLAREIGSFDEYARRN